MKKCILVLLSLLLSFSLAACGSPSAENPSPTPVSEPAEDTDSPENIEAPSQTSEEIASETIEPSASSSNMLVVYFSVPEDVSTDGVDAVAGASIVVKDAAVLGNTQYIANIIGEHTGADLFRIEPETPYPADHDPLVDLAAEEQEEDSRPSIANHIENLDAYDTIFIGFPNWWGDMPQILYTFLDEYDFSGKTLVPFCTHGGSGFSQTVASITEMEPDAAVIQEGYTVSRDNVAEADSDVIRWLESLGYESPAVSE